MIGNCRILILALLTLLCSCQRRPLLDPDSSALLAVHLVTEGMNNVTCNIYNPNLDVPTVSSDMMRMMLYDYSGQTLLSQGLLEHKSRDDDGYEVLSGALRLTEGEYKMIGYNFDIANTFVSGDDNYYNISAYTETLSSEIYSRFGTRLTPGEQVYYTPDFVMVADEPELSVEMHAGEKRIDLNAYPIVETYYIQIRISGPQNIASKAKGLAVLSGLKASTKMASSRTNQAAPASIYFELEKSIDSNIDDSNQMVLCGLFNTFGKIEGVQSDLTITLSVLTRDGKSHQKQIDMEPIFATEDARLRNWLLIDEVWDIPDPILDDNDNWTPKVDDWDDVEDTMYIGGGNKTN